MDNFDNAMFTSAAHSGESDETIHSWVDNLNKSLLVLSEKHPNAVGDVILYINGEGVDSSARRWYMQDMLKHFTANSNVDIKIKFTPVGGKTNVVAKLYEESKRVMKPILMTDVDVLRLSDSVLMLWESMIANTDKAVIGSRFFALPSEYSLLNLSSEEKFWYEIFEGDKNPLLKIKKNGGTDKVRGGQLIINPKHSNDLLRENAGADDRQINTNTDSNTRMIEERSIAFYNGRFSISNHIKARTRYKDEYSEKPTELDDIKYDDVKARLLSNNVSMVDANLYLFRVSLKSMVKVFLYEWFNGVLKSSKIFKQVHNNPLEEYKDLHTFFSTNFNFRNIDEIVLNKINFEFDNIIDELNGVGINDSVLTTNQEERGMPILDSKLEKALKERFLLE